MARPTLSADDVAKLNKSQKNLNELLPVFDDLEACDQDCQAMRDLVTQQKERITQLITRFGPKNRLAT